MLKIMPAYSLSIYGSIIRQCLTPAAHVEDLTLPPYGACHNTQREWNDPFGVSSSQSEKTLRRSTVQLCQTTQAPD